MYVETKRKAALIIDVIFIIFFIAVFYIFFKYCLVYIFPFLISFLVVYFLQKPMICLSCKTGVSKGILTVISLLVLIFSFSTLAYFSIAKVYGFIIDLFSQGKWNYLISKNGLINYINSLLSLLPENIKDSLSVNPQSLVDSAYAFFGETMETFIKYLIKILPSFLLSSVVSIVSACFFAFDYDNIVNFVKRQLSTKSIEFARRLKRIVNFSFLNLFKGYFIIMLITFFELLIGLFILDIDNAVALSLIIAFVDILPIFGAGTVIIPWSVFELISSNTKLGIYLLILYAIITAARYFIEPKIIGKKFGLNPLISLISLFIGLKLFGFLGVLLFPILVSILVILNKNGLIKLWK